VHVYMGRRHLDHQPRYSANRYPLRAMCLYPYLS
jgi:hypothetical protein